MHFPGDLEGVSREMQSLADRAPEGVQAEFEINPSNLF